MKKRTEKLMSILMISAITVSMMAGCGSSTSGTSATTSSESAASTETSAAPAAAASTAASTTETASTDDGSTPRNETLYFAGQQWGSVNDYNPMSANSNNAMVINQTDYARVLVYETLYMYNPLDGSVKGLLATGDPTWNADTTEMTVNI